MAPARIIFDRPLEHSYPRHWSSSTLVRYARSHQSLSGLGPSHCSQLNIQLTYYLIIYCHMYSARRWDGDLVVASPVEDYFLYVNELPESKKKKDEQVTKPLLNALGDD
ncbi:hypothetical protein AgCh_018249 [Apium graveolens]